MDIFGVVCLKFGSVLYGGVGIYDCVILGDIVLIFDDGLYFYINDLLDKLRVCVCFLDLGYVFDIWIELWS